MSRFDDGTYLTEALEPHIDSLSDAHRPGVYALEVGVPDNAGLERIERDWRERFDTLPRFSTAIANAERVVYVGGASDVYARLEDHCDGDVRQAALLSVWGAESLLDIWWFEDADRAMERESGIACDLQNEHPEWYVHQR